MIMGTTILLGVGIVLILVLARINKSNRLFWTFLLSLLAGFVGGTLASIASTPKKPRIEIVKDASIVTPMQSLQIAVISADNENEVSTVETKTHNGKPFASFNTTLAYKKTANDVLQPTKPFDTS